MSTCRPPGLGVFAVLFGVALFAGGSPAFAASPANDNVADAVTISGSTGSVVGSNAEATEESGEREHAGRSARSIWWRWSAPADGEVTFTTDGSAVDTVLAAQEGTAISGAVVAENDDGGLGYAARITFPVAAGSEYAIVVDSATSTSTGAVRLNWSMGAPTNDNIEDAAPISGMSGTIAGTTSYATSQVGEQDPNGSGTPMSVWYTWVAPETGAVTFNTKSTDSSSGGSVPGLAVLDGVGLDATVLDADWGRDLAEVTVDVTSGATYLLEADGGFGAGPFSVSWMRADPGAPQNVTAGSVNPSEGKLMVSWEQPLRLTGTFTRYDVRTIDAETQSPIPNTCDTTPTAVESLSCEIGGLVAGNPYDFKVRTVTTAGVSSWTHSGDTWLDIQPPTAPAITTQQRLFAVPTPISGSALIAWNRSSDNDSGVISYDVESRQRGYNQTTLSPWTWVGSTAAPTTTLTPLVMTNGVTYCFRATAYDRAGLSAISAARCVARPLDDANLASSSGWTRKSNVSGYYAKTYVQTTGAGKLLATKANASAARHLALIATTCSTCGRVDIRVASTTVATKSLGSSTTKNGVVIAVNLSTARTGKVTIVTKDAGKLVRIDALGVSPL